MPLDYSRYSRAEWLAYHDAISDVLASLDSAKYLGIETTQNFCYKQLHWIQQHLLKQDPKNLDATGWPSEIHRVIQDQRDEIASIVQRLTRPLPRKPGFFSTIFRSLRG